MAQTSRQSEGTAYIADIATLMPDLIDALELAEVLFARERVGDQVHGLATKLARDFGILRRPCALDLARFPEVALAGDEHTPINWGTRIVEQLLGDIEREEVGYLGISYNITSHQDTLPNLACQIALSARLDLDEPPQEYRSYGCASGIYSLDSAAAYCRLHDKAAIVFCFDQCLWDVIQDMDPANENLQGMVRTNLLFGDGAAGLLLVPERLRARFARPLPKILGIRKAFQAGNLIRMQDGKFLVQKEVRQVVPKMVSDRLVKPAMADLGVARDEIAEWSIHQGGYAILNGLCEESNLGLSAGQIRRSKDFFQRYGNLSSPSCLLVLDSFFHEPASLDKHDQLGLMVGFGAGYYMGAMLYQWSVPDPLPH